MEVELKKTYHRICTVYYIYMWSFVLEKKENNSIFYECIYVY